MISSKVKLTAKQILDKDFKTSMRGYQQDDVDKFLDLIIKDYEMFHKEIETLRIENEKLKKMVVENKAKPTMAPVVSTNPDILKRLSNLEKHVFGSKLYDE